MFKTATELKEFIVWAKSNHVKRVRVDNIEVELSDLAFITEYNQTPLSQEPSKTDNVSTTAEEDSDLYFSVSN